MDKAYRLEWMYFDLKVIIINTNTYQILSIYFLPISFERNDV